MVGCEVWRPTKAQWWLNWIVLGAVYFLIGISISSGSPERRIAVGLLAIALGTLLVWVTYRSLMK